jgi:PAS domain S-box-containing protein
VAGPDQRVAQLEQELRAAGQSLRVLLDRSPDAMLIHRGGSIVYANAAFAAVLGVESADALVGQTILSLIHPSDRDGAEASIRHILATDEPEPARETRMVPPQGDALRLLDIAAMPIVFDNERSILAIARDLTEKRRIDAQLRVTDRMASMGTLAAGVVHEVNNPLGYAVANIGFAMEELARVESLLVPHGDEDADALTARLTQARVALQPIAEALQEARQGGERVRQIVRDLRTFSRVDDDRRGLLDVRRVLESAINMAYNEIRHRARLVKDYGATPLVEGSEARLGQVFLNLLVNAAQSIPEGGAEQHRIRVVTGTDAQGRCVVEVLDTGHGIAAGDLRRIFEPFFTTRPGTGTGLGLSICHNIVASMGGEIAVESAIGKGTTVRVSLPRTRDASAPAPASDAAPDSAVGGAGRTRGRVLVVDDEVMMARAVQRLLEGEHDVVILTDPFKAVELLASGAYFDAMLCDLMMPTMSGMEVYDAVLRSQPKLARRIVFMTGGAFTTRATQFLESVDNARVEKPLDRAALRAAIRRQMSEE